MKAPRYAHWLVVPALAIGLIAGPTPVVHHRAQGLAMPPLSDVAHHAALRDFPISPKL